MRQLLKTYSISKTAKASFTLTFETTKNVVVKFNENNTISLSEGENNKSNYRKDYKSVMGKLHIGFLQDFGQEKKIEENPKIDIDDHDLP